MELSIMILDDEYIILDGLSSFPWEAFRCRVTAVARNGNEGMEMLREAAPDIILSDIKMPGMDGLEFSSKAKEMFPEVTIILLTGYDSFEFAKQAISTGVKEYLLKPIDYDVMKQTIDKIAAEVRENKRQNDHFQNLKRHFNNSLPLLRAHFVSNLLHGRFQGRNELKAQEDSLNMKIDKFLVAVGKKVIGAKRIEECDKWIEEFAYINIFEEIFERFHIRVLSDYSMATLEYNFILLFNPQDRDDECIDMALKACKKIQEEVKKYCGEVMNFGISNMSQDCYDASNQYRKAQEACRQCVYLGNDVILKYQDFHYKSRKEFNITTGEKSHLMMTLFQGEFPKVEVELKAIFEKTESDIGNKKFSAMDLLLSCMKFPYTCAVQSDVSDKEWDVSILQDAIGKIAQCKDVEEIESCLLRNFSTLIKLNTENADERNKMLVQNILSHIESNYASDLSMEELTERFHVSRTYISRLLKKYAGKSFLEYLTDVRFKNVECFMAENKYKQYEIAEMVGYRDFSYYIKVFKRRYGITPNEYKKHV